MPQLVEPTVPLPAGAAAVAVAVDPVALVVTECITVTSAMRKHARWAHSSVSAILGGSVGTVSSQSASLKSPRTPLVLSFKDPKAQDGKAAGSATNSVDEEIGLANRWGLRGKKGQSMQDNPLLSAFARLRSNLKRCKGKFFSKICCSVFQWR